MALRLSLELLTAQHQQGAITTEQYAEAVAMLSSSYTLLTRNTRKPPIHWKEHDGWDRHPQEAEEWDWHKDGDHGDPRVTNAALNRSIRRLNFACDQADPTAPDQMTTVLRIDLTRVLGHLVFREAQFQARKLIAAQEAEKPSQDWKAHAEKLAEAITEHVSDGRHVGPRSAALIGALGEYIRATRKETT